MPIRFCVQRAAWHYRPRRNRECPKTRSDRYEREHHATKVPKKSVRGHPAPVRRLKRPNYLAESFVFRALGSLRFGVQSVVRPVRDYGRTHAAFGSGFRNLSRIVRADGRSGLRRHLRFNWGRGESADGVEDAP